MGEDDGMGGQQQLMTGAPVRLHHKRLVRKDLRYGRSLFASDCPAPFATGNAHVLHGIANLVVVRATEDWPGDSAPTRLHAFRHPQFPFHRPALRWSRVRMLPTECHE